MRTSLLALLIALSPVCASAQTATLPVAPGGSAATPRGPDTPVATIPGGAATVAPGPALPNDTPVPAIDSSGANRSTEESPTGEAKPPIGAPRLPGEPANPPTGPSDQ